MGAESGASVRLPEFHNSTISLYLCLRKTMEGTESPLFHFLKMTDLENRIRQMLEEILQQNDSYLVDLIVRPNKVEVYADRDPHITIDDCARISRNLEKQLDEAFGFSQKYALEVSSPGMDQPLKVLRQYRKNIGRSVEVVLHSGAKHTGTLLEAGADKISIEVQQKSAAAAPPTRLEIPFNQIKSTQVVLNFKF
jgi:ribosome maturation factor RimP